MAEEKADKKGKSKITIFVNNKDFDTDEKELTGGQIKEIAGVPADYELFEVKGSHTVPIGNEEKVKLHNKQQFRAIPAGTFGSCLFHQN